MAADVKQPRNEVSRTGQQIMPLYEHVFIGRQDLSHSQAHGLVEHFSSILTENGGTVIGTESWGLLKMAYKINRNRKGHYMFLRTDAPKAAVTEMERLMRLHEDILRVMTIKVDKHSDDPTPMMQRS